MGWRLLGRQIEAALLSTRALHRDLLRLRGRMMQIDFHEATHSYRIDGRSVPSVTQVLAPQNDWSHVDAWVLEAKAALGRDVHTAMHLLAVGQLDWTSLDPAVLPYVRSGDRFIREYGLNIIAAETAVGCKALGIAGMLDAYGRKMFRNLWYDVFVDWKIAETVPTTVSAQLAAYQYLYYRTFMPAGRRAPAKRLCVRLSHTGYKVDTFKEYDRDFSLFTSCRNTFMHKERSYGRIAHT
jgi:hypothetical protein